MVGRPIPLADTALAERAGPIASTRSNGATYGHALRWQSLGYRVMIPLQSLRCRMHTLSQDLRYAIRTLGRTPGFTLVAILTLALGIGANTAIFSVVQAVLLRPLPYPRSAELMALNETLPPKGDRPARPTAIAPPTTKDWQASTSFSNIAYFADSEFVLTGAGEPSREPG